MIPVAIHFIDPHQFRRAVAMIPDLATWIGMDRWACKGTRIIFSVPPNVLMRSLAAVLTRIADAVRARVQWSHRLHGFVIIPCP